jgi:alkylhydroperoxidase family enzyme
MLAHGALLRKNFFNVEQMQAIIKDFRNAGLPPEEVALMNFAQKIVHHANKVSQEDIEGLRSYGLSDEEILNVVVTITARSFFSKTLDALDIRPDELYSELEPELIQALTIGRPFP